MLTRNRTGGNWLKLHPERLKEHFSTVRTGFCAGGCGEATSPSLEVWDEGGPGFVVSVGAGAGPAWGPLCGSRVSKGWEPRL